MKKLFFLLLTLSSCISQLNSNLERSNEVILENTGIMTEAKMAIQENTHEIRRSTAMMLEFQFIFPIIFTLIVLIFLYILFKFSRKIYRFLKIRRRK